MKKLERSPSSLQILETASAPERPRHHHELGGWDELRAAVVVEERVAYPGSIPLVELNKEGVVPELLHQVSTLGVGYILKEHDYDIASL